MSHQAANAVSPHVGYMVGVVLAGAVIGYLAAVTPADIRGVSFGLAIVVILGFIVYSFERTRSFIGFRLFMAGLLLRIAAVPAHLFVGFIVYRGDVDFVGQAEVAENLAGELLQGRFNVGPIVENQVLNFLSSLMYYVAGFSYPGFFLLSVAVGSLGSYLFIRSYQVGVGELEHNRFLVSMFLFWPSLVFWSIHFGKEPWMYLFLAATSLGFASLLNRVTLAPLLMFFLGLCATTLLRPHIGVGVAIAAGVTWVLKPRMARGPKAFLRPIYVLTSLVVMGGVVTGVLYFVLVYHLRTISIENVFRVLALRHLNLSVDVAAGGASLEPLFTGRSFGELLLYLPGAMAAYMVRPFLFEAHNVMAFVFAIEGMVLLAIFVRRLGSLAEAARSMFRNPFLMFALLVCVILTALLSIIERNFAVIVRHRPTIVLPFLLMLLAVPPGGRSAKIKDK